MSAGDLQVDRPHSARIYDFLLGGRDNFEADRQAAAKMLEHTPNLPVSMKANRRFMARVVRHLARGGIRQFLDVGTGLPTKPNLHEVAQEVAPDARVVYVDNDPLVLVHARALLTPTGTGSVAYLDADLREPETVIESDAVVKSFDLAQPVAVTLIAVLQHVTDDALARHVIDELMAPLAAGSALVLSVVTVDNDPDAGPETVRTYNQHGVPAVARSRAGVETLFGGLELAEPGVVPVHHWQPTDEDRQVDDASVYVYGGVAFKK
ncbi:SAM-dependent methyltransferase [Actinoplanes sp. NPDC051851]|uniref:SAM-dependent methyltransferase n=1 Tax=Actinoplanes sp. NPDC051851 TaxID=3154753 RepID=UPI00344309BD